MKPEERSAKLAKHKANLENWCYGNSLRHDLQHVASVITAACRDLCVEIPIVVGGAAVGIYTSGRYITHDLDMVSSADSSLCEVMLGLGFHHQRGYRYWDHPLIGFTIEFPPPPLAGDYQRLTIIVSDIGEECYLIGIEDAIIGRLEEFVFWDRCRLNAPSAVQLRLLLTAYRGRMDVDYLNRKAQQCEVSEGLETILETIENESMDSSG